MMTENDVYLAIELEFTVRSQPDRLPPNDLGHIAAFYIDELDAAPGKPRGWHWFEYVQTYFYPDMTGLQVWQCDGELFASRIGEFEPLRWIGRDLERVLHWRHIFTPQTADEIYNDLETRRVDRNRFRNELDWVNWCAMRADETVRLRDANRRRQARRLEIAELA